MKEKLKPPFYLITFGVVIYAEISLGFVIYSENTQANLSNSAWIDFSFILSVPMRGFERLLKRIFSGKTYRLKAGLSMESV